ncbi:MAG TPA: hypothetical protein VJ698_24300 [Noviherbaspirillum sp.]|uniref:hypothetical protein n=1 Tax=Noviherbaspirillum sp. TaxID=1926288 RepID=UPI002B49F0A4|nr:hypothetical protein [Noviherbaspirillum sp.]HJV88609.1 hypothetical protein [Noviherbaspirillum sp.]
MAHIVIKDLPDSMELDRKAMVAIIGGARTRGRPQAIGRTIFGGTRIVNFPTGFAPQSSEKARSR